MFFILMPPVITYAPAVQNNLRERIIETAEKKKSQAKEIEKEKLEFSLRAEEGGEPFGSVTSHDIETALEEKGYKGVKIKQEKPIKTFGKHEIEFDMGGGAGGKMKVEVKTEE